MTIPPLSMQDLRAKAAQRPDASRVGIDPNYTPGPGPLDLLRGIAQYARENPVEFGLSMTPIVGDAMSARDAVREARGGNYGMAALAGLGAIPLVGAVGDAARAGAKGAKAAKAAKALANRPVRSIADLANIADEGATGRRLAYEMGDLARVPDVPQVPITTRPIPARGVPKDVTAAVRKNRSAFEDNVKRGLDQGGLEWYNLDPLRRDYIAELGPEAGEREFARFTQHLAATSPRSKVAQNIRRSSAFSLINRHGLEVPEDQAMLSLLGPTLGHLAHRTAHLPAVRDIERLGTMAADEAVLLRRPKTSSFGENLRGNYEPVTVDAHNTRAWGLPESRTEPAYDVLEREQKDIAAKLGIRPAQVQSSAWIGAADETGVADARPFINVFQDVLEKSAERQGIPADVLYQRFLRGTATLGLAGMAGAAASRANDSQAPRTF